jgi:hypothetical protein
MARTAIRIYVLLTVASLLIVGLLFAQPASPTLAGFTPVPPTSGGGGGHEGGGGGGQTPVPSKRVVPPPVVVIAGATILATPILATPVTTPLLLPITGGSSDDESSAADSVPPYSVLPEPVHEAAPLSPQAISPTDFPPPVATVQPPVAPPAQAQPISITVPPEWMPGPSQATLIVISDAGADIVFTMGDQERKIPPHTRAAITLPSGRYGFTVSDSRFQPYRNECDLTGDSIYYWYTDDTMNADRCVRIGP